MGSSLSNQEAKNIEDTFAKYDKDADKILGIDEVRQYVTSHIPNLSKDDVNAETEKFLKAADRNKDGKISFKEFVSYARKEIHKSKGKKHPITATPSTDVHPHTNEIDALQEELKKAIEQYENSK